MKNKGIKIKIRNKKNKSEKIGLREARTHDLLRVKQT